MKRKTVSVLLALLMFLSCFAAGLPALAADDAELENIYQFLRSASKDRTEEDHNFDDALNMLAGLSSDELIAVGRRSNLGEDAAFWWAGNQALQLNRNYSSSGRTAKIRAYCPSVYLEIAERVPAYADFVGVLLDGITVYSLLIGEPTAEITFSEEERTPFAIGKRMAELPEGQAASLKSEAFFSSSNYISIEGITENLDEDKAKDESIGATCEIIDFFGMQLENWTTAYLSEDALANFSLCASFFEKTYEEAERSLVALAAFADVIEGLNAPYRTKDVETAKNAYAAVPSTAWSLADERALQARSKYRTIIASAGLEDNSVDLSAYKKTDLGKSQLSDKSANEVLKLLRSSANTDEKLSAAIAGIATGKNLVSILNSLGGKSDILASLFSISFICSNLKNDPKFAGAVKKMEALQEEGHTEGFSESGLDEENFVITVWSCADQFTSADFGFEDGDFYGFADALGGCLSGLSELLNLVSGFSFKNIASGDNYTIGKYEDLIPLFELLDLPTPSSAEFTKAEEAMTFTDTEGNTFKNPVRAGVNCLLKPLADYLTTTFKKAPTDAVIDLLPKVAYAIESGLLSSTVEKLLEPFKELGVKVDVSKDTFWGMVDRSLVTPQEVKNIDGTKTRMTQVGFDLDKDGQKEPVPLTKAQFDKLVTDIAGCAEPAVKPSVSIPNANRMGLNTQKSKVISVLLAAVLEMEKNEAGESFLDKALDGMGAPSLVKKLLGFAAKRGTAFTFKLLDRFLPIISFALSVMSLIKRIKALFGR